MENYYSLPVPPAHAQRVYSKSTLASFYVRTFFVDSSSWAKLAKIGESMNLSGSTPGEKSSAVTRCVV